MQKVQLKDILYLQNGYAFKSNYFNLEKTGIPLIRISNIRENLVSLNDLVWIKNENVPSKDFYVSKGDLLIAMSGATTGKMGVYKGDMECLLNQRVGKFCIEENNEVNRDFVINVLLSGLIQKEIFASSAGGAQPNISSKTIEKISILLPSLPEQKKIAEILTGIDQLILKKRLLLKKIHLLSKAHIVHQIYKFHNHQKFKNSCFGKIPFNWEIKSLNQLGDFKNGINKSKEAFGRGTKFVNISDAYLEEIDVDALDRLEVSMKEIEEYKLKEGDLVFVRSSVKLDGVGVPTVFKGANEDVLFCGFMIRFRLKQKDINPFFLKEYLLTNNARIRIEKIATGGANININQQYLGDFKILLPPQDEQDFIVSTNLKFKNYIEELTIQIQKLNFLKSCLIQKLLNGQVRVKI